MSTTHGKFMRDPGLNANAIALMSSDETREYLKLLLEVLKPDLPSLTWLREAHSVGRVKKSRGMTPRALRVNFLARLAVALQANPALIVAQSLLRAADAAGLDARVLYQQAVAVRPTDWAPAPPYESLMAPEGVAMNATPHSAGITREHATLIAIEYVGRAPPFAGCRVGKVVAWNEVDRVLPHLYAAPHGIEDSWVAYLDSPNEPLALRSSRTIVVSRTSGVVLYAGDANDEG